MLDLDLVLSLRETSLVAETTSSPQLVALDSRLRQFLTFKLAPTHMTPVHPRGENNWVPPDPKYVPYVFSEFVAGQHSP